jgi:hypothetical protein
MAKEKVFFNFETEIFISNNGYIDIFWKFIIIQFELWKSESSLQLFG